MRVKLSNARRDSKFLLPHPGPLPKGEGEVISRHAVRNLSSAFDLRNGAVNLRLTAVAFPKSDVAPWKPDDRFSKSAVASAEPDVGFGKSAVGFQKSGGAFGQPVVGLSKTDVALDKTAVGFFETSGGFLKSGVGFAKPAVGF